MDGGKLNLYYIHRYHRLLKIHDYFQDDFGGVEGRKVRHVLNVNIFHEAKINFPR